MNLVEDTTITVGKRGEIEFEKGWYLYVGSAPSEKRLERHLRKEKNLFWHIDYFLEKAEIVKIYIMHNRRECEVAESIELPSIEGFGCSDCTCRSHLFFGELPEMKGATQYYP